MNTDTAAPPSQLCDRFAVICLAFIVGFYGSWAILAQTAVQFSATLSTVRWLVPVSAVVGVAFSVLAARLRVIPIAHAERPRPSLRGVMQDKAIIGWAALALALTCCGALAIGLDRRLPQGLADYVLFLGCLTFIAGAVWLFMEERRPVTGALQDYPSGPSSQYAAFVVILALALIPLFFHKPNSDDALFLNLAESMICDPRAILTYDAILGDPEQRLMLPTYRVEVQHALVASVAVWTNSSAIVAAHLILAPMTCLTIACAYYLFSRLFGGREWLTVLVIGVAILLLSGDIHNSHGGFSFTRAQQGKSLMFAGLVPLIYAFAAQFWHTGKRTYLALLFATLAASSGVTANGLFIAPLALLMAGCALFAAGPAHITRLALVGTMGVWPVLAALTVLMTTGAFASEVEQFRSVADNLKRIFGQTRGLPVFGLALSAWLLFEGWTRRFLLMAGLMFLLIVMNPLVDPILADAVTGNLNWRLFHAFPAPLFAALALGALWARLRPVLPLARPLWAAGMAALAGLVAFAPISILKDRGRTHFSVLGLDVDDEHRSAQQVHAKLAKGSTVLAPLLMAEWLSTFPSPKALVATRSMYMTHYRKSRAGEDIDRRRAALALVDIGKVSGLSVTAQLKADIAAFGMTDVIIPRDNPLYHEIAKALADLGFRRVNELERYIHWQARAMASEPAQEIPAKSVPPYTAVR